MELYELPKEIPMATLGAVSPSELMLDVMCGGSGGGY
jgi:hypothetical protein